MAGRRRRADGGTVLAAMNAPMGPATSSLAEGSALFEQPLPFALGDYVVAQKIGQGGMGAIFLARQTLAGDDARLVVLKTLRHHIDDEDEYARRFFDEARVVVRLAHPAVCRVFEVGEVAGRLYLAMEHILGVDLTTVLHAAHQRGQPTPPGVAIAIVERLLDALDYAHHATDPNTGEALGLVHRDVSPHNLMVGFGGDTWLIDFGLATSVLKRERTATNVVMGKLAYMAPEHARGQPVDARADQYAAAQTLYELLSGERFYGDMRHREIWQVAGKGHLPPGLARLDDDVAALLRTALASAPEQRHETCGTFREALLRCAARRGWNTDRRDVARFVAAVLPGERERRQASARAALDAQAPVGLMAAATVRSAPAPGSTDDALSTTGAHAAVLVPGAPVDATQVSGAPQALDSDVPTAALPSVERTVVVRRSEATALVSRPPASGAAPLAGGESSTSLPPRRASSPPAEPTLSLRSLPALSPPSPTRPVTPLIVAGVAAGLALVALLVVGLRPTLEPTPPPPPTHADQPIPGAAASDSERAVTSPAPTSTTTTTEATGAGAEGAGAERPGASSAPVAERNAARPSATPAKSEAPRAAQRPRQRARRSTKRSSNKASAESRLPPPPRRGAAPVALVAYLNKHCAEVPCTQKTADVLKRFMSQQLSVEQASTQLRDCVRTCRR